MKYLGLSAAYNDEETLPYFFERLNALTPKLSTHVFCTNNCIDRTNEMIGDKGYECINYTLHPEFIKKMGDPYSALAIAWQRLLRRAREILREDETYTHVVYLDTDIFIDDEDALTKASNWGKNILCGSYLRDFPDGRYLATTFQVNDDVIQLMPAYWRKRGEYYHYGQVFYDLIRPYTSSAGFMMLSREIVLDTRINFWPIYKMGVDGVTRSEVSPEYGYQVKARTLGYETWLDGTIKLRHYILPRHRSWRSNGCGGYVAFRYLSPVVLAGTGSTSLKPSTQP